MAGYVKVWTGDRNDPYVQGMKLSERGVWYQLPVIAKDVGDTGGIFLRNWTAFGSVLGCDGKTCRKILGKFHEDGKLVLDDSGGVISVFLCNYEHDQRLRKPGIQKTGEKSGKIPPISRPKQTRPEHTTVPVVKKVKEKKEDKRSPLDRFNAWAEKNGKTMREMWRNIDRKQYDQYEDKTFFSKADTDLLAAETGKMRNWIIANPQRGKKSRWGQFVTGWLTRTYEKKQVTPMMTNKQEQGHYASHKRTGPDGDFTQMGLVGKILGDADKKRKLVVTDQSGNPIKID